MLSVEIALKMLWEKKTRAVVTGCAITVLFFLSMAQVGLLVGWCNTVSAVILHADADVWIVAEKTTAFDYGSAIPENRIYQARTLPEVGWAAGMFVGWNRWQCPDGSQLNVQMIGLDEELVGGPWHMQSGEVSSLRSPEKVIVDELFLSKLGIDGIGAEAEFFGARANVAAVSRGVRTFTASPVVFTTIERARHYDRRYRDDEVTYVLLRAAEGYSAEEVRDAVLREIPYVDCLTTDAFARRTIKYWMLETGVGITVAATAVLAFLVSTVVISQTLYAITQDHRTNYATLLAIGFSRLQLSAVVLVQAVVFGLFGIVAGSAAFFFVSQTAARTPVPLDTTPLIFATTVGLALGVCVLASFLAVKSVWSTDPEQVFRS
jgi:putative ABC transport system permease protein